MDDVTEVSTIANIGRGTVLLVNGSGLDFTGISVSAEDPGVFISTDADERYYLPWSAIVSIKVASAKPTTPSPQVFPRTAR